MLITKSALLLALSSGFLLVALVLDVRSEEKDDSSSSSSKNLSKTQISPSSRSIGSLLFENRSPSQANEQSNINEASIDKFPRTNSSSSILLRIQVTAIHVDKSEFPLNKLLFRLTLRLALEAVEKQLQQSRVKILLSVRSSNTCSRQYAGAIAAEEYYTKKTRLFIVSGCDDAIRSVSRLASVWKVPVMTAAGFGADLNDKSVHKTLVRVAFSLRAAVEFLFKIMKSFKWHRFNLIVDESDSNSLALKGSIERLLKDSSGYQMSINTIFLDLQLLNSMHRSNVIKNDTNTTQINIFSGDLNGGDKWPNEIAERAVRDALRQSSLYSRVNVLLIPQHYLRRFMLSAYDQRMANGLYTFITMPLLLISNEEQEDNSLVANSANSSRRGYTTFSDDNFFIWRSTGSKRNSQARQAFESLMSIYLRSPTNKAYLYFVNKLYTLASNNFATSTTTTQATIFGSGTSHSSNNKIQMHINPYSASFYDCLQIYSTALIESLQAIFKESDKSIKRKLKINLHANISEAVRNRRFDNLVTGSVFINSNGDRDSDYTLDDMNHMTGKFSPVILYRGETRDMERLSRIHWSSDPTIQQTTDTVDCALIGTCTSKPISRFLVVFGLLAVPLAIFTTALFYFVHNRLSLESQLVDYWWKIKPSDIEFIEVRRKNARGGSSVVSSGVSGSIVSSSNPDKIKSKGNETVVSKANTRRTVDSHGMSGNMTTITKTTGTSAVSSALDVCYGDISLGIYKMTKVAVKSNR